MPADGTKAAHLAHGNLGMSRLEQLLKTIQHVLVCKEGDGLPFSEMEQSDLSRCPLCRRSRSISGRNLDTAESTRMTRSRLSAPLIRSPRRMPIGNQRDAIAKTCRSKRAYSFLICTRALSNSVLRVVLYREHASCLSRCHPASQDSSHGRPQWAASNQTHGVT